MELVPYFGMMLPSIGLGMRSPVAKRSIYIDGHKTSVTLEDAFWQGLKEIAQARRMTMSDLIGEIDAQRQHSNLSSGLRLFVLDFYRKQVASYSNSLPPPGAQPI
jgi:predicted DNA-binding ribbon-helix-helix protein